MIGQQKLPLIGIERKRNQLKKLITDLIEEDLTEFNIYLNTEFDKLLAECLLTLKNSTYPQIKITVYMLESTFNEKISHILFECKVKMLKEPYQVVRDSSHIVALPDKFTNDNIEEIFEYARRAGKSIEIILQDI